MASKPNTHSSGLSHLMDQIAYNQRVADQISASPSHHQAVLSHLQQWQRARLDATYVDLRSSTRYQAACEFFLDELYGGRDVAQRDAQLERAAPIMRRFLPDDLLAAVGDALRLQAMSLHFDFELAGLLLDGPVIDQPHYASAYRAHQQWAGRREQLELIDRLGVLLGETVRHAMVHRLIRMMRTPAKLAGVGLLQAFLQEGLDAFAKMGSTDHFLDVIHRREHQALDAIEGGEDFPFHVWIGDGPDPIKVAKPSE